MMAEDLKSDEQLEWSAFYDDGGEIFYYNNVTKESSWDAPEFYNPPPERPSAEAKHSPMASAWVSYQLEDGRTYYFNPETEETTWDKPDGFAEAAETIENVEDEAKQQEEAPDNDARGISPTLATSPALNIEAVTSAMEVDTASTEPEREEEAETETEEPVVKAMAALKQTDAIMEPGVLAHVTAVVTSEGGKPLSAIEALSDSFFGETAACGLMSRWLADLKSLSSSTDASEQALAFQSATDEIRDMVQDVIDRLASESFTKTGGDKILNLSKSEADFLKEMMVSSRWRKLLIDLSASNKDSALLMYCLEQISKRGHHREIARRINQSDHFTVFHAMLASELSVIGKIAVTACKGTDTAILLDDLVGDLKRTCTSTAYTYIYALEVLRQLVETAKQQLSSNPQSQYSLFARAIRKWERLNEELQSAIVDPVSADTSSTPLFRKRRLDVAITISELHQRQRRRMEPSEDREDKPTSTKADLQKAQIESAVLEFLRRYSLGTVLDDRILDAMLSERSGNDTSNMVGKIMIKRPLTIKALFGYLYKPASHRVSAATMKNKCARLVSMAVHAAQDEALAVARKVDYTVTIERDEVTLTRHLLEGSRLCEVLENMVSFIVTSSGINGEYSADASPGLYLSSLAMKCAPVAQGVAMWAREVTKGSEYVSSASYPTLSPRILSLMRVLFLKHTFVRDDTMEVAICFLKHSNSEISYQTMNEIKEQSLRLLLFLCARGEAPIVVGRLTRILTSTTYLDASLVRYFVSGLLQVAAAPFSIPFVRLLCHLLKAPGTSEAIKTTYFDDASKLQLNRIVRYMSGLEINGTHGKLSPEDITLLKSVVSLYTSTTTS